MARARFMRNQARRTRRERINMEGALIATPSGRPAQRTALPLGDDVARIECSRYLVGTHGKGGGRTGTKHLGLRPVSTAG